MVAVYCILAVDGSDRLLSVEMNVMVMRKRRHQVFVERKERKRCNRLSKYLEMELTDSSKKVLLYKEDYLPGPTC